MSIPSINTSFQADSLAASASALARTQSAERTAVRDASAGQSMTPATHAAQTASPTITRSAPGAPGKAGDAAAEQASPPLDKVQQAMEEVMGAIAPVAQDLLFSIDDDTGKTVIKVVDASTDEVIRQIPSEEIISIAKALDKLKGLLIEQKA